LPKKIHASESQKVMGSKFNPSGGLEMKHLQAQCQWTYLTSGANSLSGEVGYCVVPANHELPNQKVADRHQLFYISKIVIIIG